MDPNEARQKLIASLAKVCERLGEGADDWRFSLLRTFREYCLAIEIDKDLLLPVQKLLNEIWTDVTQDRRRKEGQLGTPMPAGESMSLVFGAAAVTVLREAGVYPDIDKALRAVARASGIDRKRLRSFRDNLSRGKALAEVAGAYHDSVNKLRAWQPQEILTALGKFPTFVT